jgi:hypothetical protein
LRTGCWDNLWTLREEVAEGWRRLNNEELHKLCASQNTTREMKSKSVNWARHVARMGKMRNAYNILVGKAGMKCNSPFPSKC